MGLEPTDLLGQSVFKTACIAANLLLYVLETRVEVESTNNSFADCSLNRSGNESMGPDRVELSEEPPHIYYSTVLQTAVRNKALVFG